MSEKIKFDAPTMRLLSILANQVGHEGTLFHEIESAFKDSIYERNNLVVQLDAANAEIEKLREAVRTKEKLELDALSELDECQANLRLVTAELELQKDRV